MANKSEAKMSDYANKLADKNSGESLLRAIEHHEHGGRSRAAFINACEAAVSSNPNGFLTLSAAHSRSNSNTPEIPQAAIDAGFDF